jgi:hypothetical protein
MTGIAVPVPGQDLPYYPPDPSNSTVLKGAANVRWQPAFDKRALYLPMLAATKGKLSRGYIMQDQNDQLVRDRNPGGKPLGLQFLYNPTEVNVGYSISTDITPKDAQPNQATSAVLGVPGSTSLSFNLILDRTYDVWQNRRHIGIRADIEQFERMLQYTPELPFVQPVNMYVVFNSYNRMKYYGFFQNFQVVYTHWTQAGVPYRGGITGIQFQIIASNAASQDVYRQDDEPPKAPAPSKPKEGTGREGKKVPPTAPGMDVYSPSLYPVSGG